MLALVVPFGGKVFFKLLICKDASLGKTIHPLSNLDTYPSIRSDNVPKVVTEDDFVRNDVKTETHVFGVWHGAVEVEVGKVNAQKLCPQSTGGGIDEEFGRGEIDHWCAFLARIIDAIAANGEPNAMFLFILWSIIAANAAIGGVFVSCNVRLGDEKTCVSAGDVFDTLEELPESIGKTVHPKMLVFVHVHQVSIFEDIASVIIDDGTNEVNG